jgi:hypothetical protein
MNYKNTYDDIVEERDQLKENLRCVEIALREIQDARAKDSTLHMNIALENQEIREKLTEARKALVDIHDAIFQPLASNKLSGVINAVLGNEAVINAARREGQP